jgi:hypothetical protein
LRQRRLASTGIAKLGRARRYFQKPQKQQPRLVVTVGQFHQSKVVAFRNDPTLDARITGAAKLIRKAFGIGKKTGKIALCSKNQERRRTGANVAYR